MLARWLRKLLWGPFELQCRRFPLWPFRASVTEPVEGVRCIRIGNVLTHALSELGGGYEYAVSYLVDGTLLVDTGFPWARRCLKATLIGLAANRTIACVVNTHYHEDHTGNNDLLAEMTGARIVAHPLAVPEIRFPPELPWFRNFLFGPGCPVEVEPIPPEIKTSRFRFEVQDMPGHCPGHVCLFEPERRWLFSGDLYVAAELDSQLCDADGPAWIASLRQAMALHPACLFDGHGTVILGEEAVTALLRRKLDFLLTIQERALDAAGKAQTLREITRKVFDRRDLVDHLSIGEGWLSLLTASNFTRSQFLKSFLRAAGNRSDPRAFPDTRPPDSG
jgi:glyoxylase-like metal-dependent hydrolase (beta-lactamase superfamily II)